MWKEILKMFLCFKEKKKKEKNPLTSRHTIMKASQFAIYSNPYYNK